mmetsp:Transcript_34009/g.64742  ORF Transcript_34009/g.64742 Transcript_34009/m.64742 type:complete len:92 (+) Transcript_34009:63-338(+)
MSINPHRIQAVSNAPAIPLQTFSNSQLFNKNADFTEEKKQSHTKCILPLKSNIIQELNPLLRHPHAPQPPKRIPLVIHIFIVKIMILLPLS